ncbi:hypothetical protein [Halorubrum trapanicum]|uniref:hypothetical protein n=1 Tax=Halorubrum trapanicum TaxID=29284 RepID=UPI0012FD6545|nr:hypothetical protein [Halorubrum trapanicum]
MGPVKSISVRTPAITDGGWGEGNDGAGNGGFGNGISIGIDPLINGEETNEDESDRDPVRIYSEESGLIGRAKIVFVVPNACGNLPIYFESVGPLYPGVRGTEHSDFDPSSRVLNLRTNESLSDDGLLEIKADTDYLPEDRYLLTIFDLRAEEVLEQVELVKNAAIE